MKKLLSLIILIFCCPAIFGQIYEKGTVVQRQPRNLADISILSVKFENYVPANAPATPQVPGAYQLDRPQPIDSPNVKCSITVHNGNDINASETILVAMLPVDVMVISLSSSNAVIHKSGAISPFPGCITFTLGQMTPGQNITLSFGFTKSKYGNSVGAYAYSVVPDPNPGNNYKQAGF